MPLIVQESVPTRLNFACSFKLLMFNGSAGGVAGAQATCTVCVVAFMLTLSSVAIMVMVLVTAGREMGKLQSAVPPFAVYHQWPQRRSL